MPRPLEDRLALVTGSSRGIGAAIAQRLARDGAAVIVHYSSSPERADDVVRKIEDAGGKAQAVQADLSSNEGVASLSAAIDGAFDGRFGGRLDILVNNAGSAEFGPFLETSESSYDKLFDVNVRAPIALAKDAGRRMRKAGSGRIITIGSVYGEIAPMGGVTLYATTKFAMHGFTRALSRELGPLGITVNAVQPGPIATDLSPSPGSDEYETMVKATSVGRFGTAEEIASAVAYLASPEASYVNGENLTIDGGTSA